MPLDRRRHARRDDLADRALAGRITAPAFADGIARRIAVGATDVLAAPARGGATTEALYGESVRVFEDRDGWAWVQLDGDGYVGYVDAGALASPLGPPTDRVAALRTYVYERADIKSPTLRLLSLNAMLVATERLERFLHLADGGYVVRRHTASVATFAPDFVAVAERFVGTPYRWGGKTSLGIDCSGLVQVALEAAGIRAPRDSDMLEAEVGEPVPLAEGLAAPRRGDLVFWKGHAGIMVDGARLLHANAHHMETVIEPLSETIARTGADGNLPTSVRRLPPPGAPR